VVSPAHCDPLCPESSVATEFYEALIGFRPALDQQSCRIDWIAAETLFRVCGTADVSVHHPSVISAVASKEWILWVRSLTGRVLSLEEQSCVISLNDLTLGALCCGTQTGT
jgi:hypothetical protein